MDIYCLYVSVGQVTTILRNDAVVECYRFVFKDKSRPLELQYVVDD